MPLGRIAWANTTVPAFAPRNWTAPVVTSNGTTIGSVASTTTGYWVGTKDLAFTYQWKRSGSSIGGATAAAYTLVEGDEAGTTLTCVVTATNATGSASATSNGLTIPAVAPSAPVIAGTVTI